MILYDQNNQSCKRRRNLLLLSLLATLIGTIVGSDDSATTTTTADDAVSPSTSSAESIKIETTAIDANGNTNKEEECVVAGTTNEKRECSANLLFSDEQEEAEEDCAARAKLGECQSNMDYMFQHCIPTCLEQGDLGTIGYFLEKDEEDKEEEEEECVDTLEVEEGEISCGDYADYGECYKNPEFMYEECAKSCLICITPGTLTFPIGVGQEIPEDEKDNEALIIETLEVIAETSHYMSTVVMEDDEYDSIRRDCVNHDAHCAAMAASGKCDVNDDDDEDYAWYKFMMSNCAPACQACDTFDMYLSCTPNYDMNIFEEGDLDKMFRRIVGELPPEDGVTMPEYTARILSRPSHPENVSKSEGEEQVVVGEESDYILGPWVVTLDNLITDEECDELIQLGHNRGYFRSTVEDEDDLDPDDEDAYRTSVNSWCQDECYKHPTTERVVEKLSALTGMPDSYSEYLQMLKYDPGQYYKVHHDMAPDSVYHAAGNRILTVFLYLNDVEEGGATRFEDLGPGHPTDVVPKKGMALIWPSVLDEDPSAIDERTYHEALPTIKGEKYGANAWFRLREFKRDRCDYDEWYETVFWEHDDEDEDEEEEEDGEEGTDSENDYEEEE